MINDAQQLELYSKYVCMYVQHIIYDLKPGLFHRFATSALRNFC